MKAKEVYGAFREILRYWYFTVPFVGFLSGLFLFVFHETEFSTLFVVTIIAFIASDLLTPLFMRGGKGICQVTVFGTLTVPEGYGFLAFFATILILTIGVNILTDYLAQFTSGYLSDFWVNLLIGFSLAGLVYLDLWLKFYKHENK